MYASIMFWAETQALGAVLSGVKGMAERVNGVIKEAKNVEDLLTLYFIGINSDLDNLMFRPVIFNSVMGEQWPFKTGQVDFCLRKTIFRLNLSLTADETPLCDR